MRTRPFLLTLALLLTASPLHAAVEQLPTEKSPRVTLNFDSNWNFTTTDTPTLKTSFANTQTRQLNLPHDWSIEGPYDQNAITLRGGGYLPSGIGWYAKEFALPPEYANKKVFVEFDGAMANAEVFLNGQSLGKRPFGYSSFQYELTTHGLLPDKPNYIAVRCDNTAQPASRFYAGAGIYRHVRLVVTDPVHIDHWATFISTPEVSAAQARVRIKTTLINQSATPQLVSLDIALSDGSTPVQSIHIAPKEIAPNKSADIDQEIPVDRPHLWDVNDPHLYTATLTVRTATQPAPVDTEITPFGIRLLEWKPATGFWLNGVNLKLLGVCLHHEAGAVGAAVPLSIWDRRLRSLKALGVNAIRTAHNPMDPDFLALCDRLGILVMEETFDTWTAAKPNAGQGYNRIFNDWFQADTRDMVLRDRNHPSIIIWSAGNEIRDPLNTPLGRDRFIAQRDIYHALDPTRPLTLALFRPNTMNVYAKGGFGELMDLVGQNYAEADLIAAWKQDPTRKVIGTENRHDAGAWRALRDNPFMIGQFLWTGYDYLGESDWPYVSRYLGLYDRTGRLHARGYQRQSWWSTKPMVAILRQEGITPAMGATAAFPHFVHDWSPADPSAPASLEIYSNCDTVELFLNNKSLGVNPINADATARTWKLPFEPGTLKAVAKNKDKDVASDELTTAGKPAAISLSPDRKTILPSFDDVAVFEVLLRDDKGVPNPRATDLVTFKLSGPGAIIAVDNGDAGSHESYQGNTRHLHEGRAIAIVRATGPGPIALTASVPNLPDASATINAAAASR